ncbi:MAG TPA: glutathionylspermidine synthase family protein [Candidatus Paceibacterota bacterium]|nr:glutathionylspermidine synthase family protein [Candidatus Paceibacterota bacterium]
MERLLITPRANWQEKVERLGLIWHTAQGQPYWNESAYYRFSAEQVDEIERATEALYQLFVAAGDRIVNDDDLLTRRFGIPKFAIPLIKRAWDEEPPALNFGRFDLGYNGRNPPKLFEFNCDTPTSLFEAAVVQWDFKEDRFPGDDQFTSLHDKLVDKWRDVKPHLKSNLVHFVHVDDAAGEDTLTTTYHRDLAQQAGLETEGLFIEQVGWDKNRRRFVDLYGRPIDVLFHLYPWEWLIHDDFGEHIVECYDQMQWIEPIWKMMWSNKAILPILWEMNPGHPNLLPSYFDRPASGDYVEKPILAREGANVTIVSNGVEVAKTDGDYGEEGFIYQQLYNLPDFDGNYPIIGSWVVEGWAAGMGIREGGLITGNTGRFVPHVFTPA